MTKKSNNDILSLIDPYKIAMQKYDTLKAFMQAEYLLNEMNSRLNRLEPWKKSGIEK